MDKVQVAEESKTPPTRPNFSYRGMAQTLIDILRFDSNFERVLADILLQSKLSVNRSLLVTGQGRQDEALEGVSLASYNRLSVGINYCESGIHGLGTTHVQIECPGNAGAAQTLFEKLRLVGVPGGEIGCTTEPERTFVTRHNLAGSYAPREQPVPASKSFIRTNDFHDKKTDITQDLKTIAQVLLLGHSETRRLIEGGQTKVFYRSIRERLNKARYLRLAKVINSTYLT
jgi:hypothetical protein